MRALTISVLFLVAAPANATSLQKWVDLGPGCAGWRLELIPGGARNGGVHSIRISDESGRLRQVIQQRSELRASHWLDPLLEDLDFDGYLDLGVIRDPGPRSARYQVWRFDHRAGRFVETPLTRALSELPNLEADRDRRELRAFSTGTTEAWTRRYRVVGGKLQLIREERSPRIPETMPRLSSL